VQKLHERFSCSTNGIIVRPQVDSVCRVRQGSTVDELIEAVCALHNIYGVVCKRLSFVPTRIRQCKVDLHAKYD